jgi:hypothetical protein
MKSETPVDATFSRDNATMRRYSSLQELVNNIPYAGMVVLGAVILFIGFSGAVWGPIAAAAYFLYGIAGALWIMLFVCPYCSYYNTRSCPCGYGHIATRLSEKKTRECFTEKFKKHIPVIVPLWLIPVLAGVLVIVSRFSWLLLSLLIVFGLEAFVFLPLVSKKHGCKECPQKDICPWMGRKEIPVGSPPSPADWVSHE